MKTGLFAIEVQSYVKQLNRPYKLGPKKSLVLEQAIHMAQVRVYTVLMRALKKRLY